MSSPDKGGEITITIGPNAQSAALSIPESFDPSMVTAENLATLAQAKGVVLGEPEHTNLARIAESFAAKPRPLNVVFTKAQAAVNGKDGWIEWEEAFAPESDDTEDSEEARDYYNTGTYSRVAEGDRLGRIYPPEAGVDGRDVMGNAINAAEGNPQPYTFDAGSFTISDEGDIVAQIDGALRLCDQEYSIVDLIEVRGNVDFSTGNIETTGSVRVTENVKDNFRIVAGKDIEVRGLVEAAFLSCEGDLNLRAGMEARQQGLIEVRSNVRAGYLNQVRGSINGDLYLAREAMSCELNVGGNLYGERAALIGGRNAISGSIEVGSLGSRMEAPTELVVGSLPLLEEELQVAQNQIREATKRIEAIAQEESMLLANMKHLSASQKERYTVIEFERAEATALVEAAKARITEIETIISERSQVNLLVRQMIHPRVSLITESQNVTTTKAIKGPVSLSWSEDRRLMIRGSGGEWRDAQAVVKAAA